MRSPAVSAPFSSHLMWRSGRISVNGRAVWPNRRCHWSIRRMGQERPFRWLARMTYQSSRIITLRAWEISIREAPRLLLSRLSGPAHQIMISKLCTARINSPTGSFQTPHWFQILQVCVYFTSVEFYINVLFLLAAAEMCRSSHGAREKRLERCQVHQVAPVSLSASHLVQTEAVTVKLLGLTHFSRIS